MVPNGDRPDLLFTADFFTPIVDDPYDFGAIAAANAFSDIYAKGGTPLAALNLAAFPDDLDKEILREVLRGGADKATEAGAPIVGGHTVRDREIKYGLAVIGHVGRGGFIPIGNARVDDALVLGKPIGTGILATALKRGALDTARMASLTATMQRLNRDAGEIAHTHGASASTDVTGYGLLGHLLNMVRAARVEATISFSAIPVLEGAIELARAGFVPGGGKANLTFSSEHTTFVEELDVPERHLLADPQTSGGLLLAVAGSEGERLAAHLREARYIAAVIGRVSAGGVEGGRIVVRR